LRSTYRHVVIVVLDTARADVFEPYGAHPDSSPAVGQLARSGWAAPYAVAPSSWTLPSHVGMLFGRSHRRLGLGKDRQSNPQAARPILDRNAARYLPRVLQRNGFHTVGASTNLWVQEIAGFHNGFDEWHPLWRSRQPGLAGEGFKTTLRWVREGYQSHHDDGLGRVREVADRWATDAASSDQPSLLFCNLVECHSPYLPPRPYNDLGPVQRVRAGLEAQRHLGMEAVWRANLAAEVPPASVLDRMRHLYARSIRYMDDWLGGFADKLDALGILDDTLFVITSDHGENLGEGNRFGHSFSLDDTLVRVPLVVTGATHVRPDGPFPLTALPRFVVDELGITDHPYDEDLPTGTDPAVTEVDGVGELDDPRVVEKMAEWGLGDAAARLMTSNATAASDGRLKLLRRGDSEVVFDLAADPFELAPLDPGTLPAGDHGAVRKLRTAADGAPLPTGSTEPSAPEPAVEEVDTDQLAEQMRLLGYL
jgi:arylsulfatase A-like enzyme